MKTSKNLKNQPLNKIEWISRDELKPNDYNPNMVAPPELKLLKISILEDGWTQPIVVTPDKNIVDGFHRWTVSGHKEIFELTDGLVPVVFLSPKKKSSLKMSTIRHNRARGTHAVLKMADIVVSLIREKIPTEDICKLLQMEKEEVIRLAQQEGIPKTELISNSDFSSAWTPV